MGLNLTGVNTIRSNYLQLHLMCQDLKHKILSVQNLSKIKMLEIGIFFFSYSNKQFKAYYKCQKDMAVFSLYYPACAN